MRPMRYLALLLAFTLVAVSCGDDDDGGGGGTAAGGDETTDTTEAEGEGDDAQAFCDAYLGVEESLASEGAEGGDEGGEPAEDGGSTTTVAERSQGTTTTTAGGGDAQPLPPEIEEILTAVEEAAPDEIADDVATVTSLVREGDPSVFESPEFREPEDRIDQYVAGECADGTSEVTGIDYAFQGFETELPAGQIAFAFTNEGEELHEIALVRINDEVDLSVQELLELPEGEADTMITEVPGGAFAFPGESDTELIELEAGRYAMVCFIPVGLTPAVAESGEEPAGAPHFTEGMFGEFTVE